jgi:hypothetical protein
VSSRGKPHYQSCSAFIGTELQQHRGRKLTENVSNSQEKFLSSSSSDDKMITLLSQCTGLLHFQLAFKSLGKQCSILCRCTQSEFGVVRRFRFVSLTKYLLPPASNSTLKALQPDFADLSVCKGS